MADFFFLLGEERHKFDTPGRCVPRHITQQFPGPEAEKPVLLTQHLLHRIDQHIREGHSQGALGHWFEGMVVTVQPNDGMTWSAEAAARAVVNAHPTVRRWLVADSLPPDGLPAIAHYVGREWFLAAAAKRGLASPYLTWRSWQAMAVVAVLLLLASVTQVVGESPVKGLPVTARTLGLAILFAGLSLGATILKTWLTPRTFENALKSFLERQARAQGADSFAQFVDDVAQRLQGGPFPRLVVIENYQVLDRLTQETIERYFSEFASLAAGSETWVVFEPPGAARLAQRVTRRRREDERHGRGYAGTSLYTQQFLSEEERRQLLKKLGEDPEAAAGIAAVKLLCEGIGPGDEIYTIASEHRKARPRGPKGYTDLDLLYFLALTSTRVRLDPRTLLNRLIDQQPRRAKLLPVLFRVPQLRKDDLRLQLARLPGTFPSLVRLEGDGAQGRLAIGTEVTEALVKHGELGLPDTALAHAFWAMYWFDDVFNTAKADEAFWIREIATHLSRAGLSDLEDEALQRDLARQLHDIALFTARACLRVGLFRQVAPTLQRCTDYLAGLTETTRQQRQAILRTAWEAYSVFGEDALLAIVLENTATAMPAAATDVPEDIALFLDSLALTEEARARLGPALLEGGLVLRGEELADYARVRGGWLALSATCLSGAVPRVALRSATIGIGEAARSAATRLTNEKTAPLLVDLLTLNAGLWCLAVNPTPRIPLWSLTRTQDFARILAAGPQAALAELSGLAARANLLEVIELADTAALVGRYLQGRQFSRTVDTNFLREGLTVEVSVLALTACVVAGLRAREEMRAEEFTPLLDRIRGVRDIVEETLEYDLPAIDDAASLGAPTLLTRVDDLLRMCALVWRKMDVPPLTAFVQIRRLAFRSASELREGGRHSDTLLELASALASHPNYVGVMANLELAAFHERAAEVSAHYLEQAARTAIAAGMGDRVRQPLSVLALFGQHSFGFDPAPLVSEMASRGFTALRDALSQPEDRTSGTFLVLLNVAGKLKSAELEAAWQAEIASLASSIVDPVVKEEVEALIEVYSLRGASLTREEVADRLDRWQSRRDLWLYPGLLENLLDSGHETERIAAEAAAICGHDPGDDLYNTHLLLALRVAERTTNDARAGASPIVDYLRNAAPRWTNGLSADMNLRMYTVLARAGGPSAGAYQIERAKWQQRLIEREHLRTLPQLARRREFFLLFFEYFHLMHSWGLELAGDATLLDPRTRDEEARRAALAEWNTRYGALVPIETRDGVPVVSADFLGIGLCLCTPPLDADPQFDDQRRVVNARSKRYLPALLESIRTMPDVPPFLRQVFDRHSRRLEMMVPAA